MTVQEVLFLFDKSQERAIESIEFQAALHGADMRKNASKSGNFTPVGDSQTQHNGDYLFKPPEAYKHLSKEELKKENDRVFGFMKSWAGKQSGLGR